MELTRILLVSEPGKDGVFVVVRDLIRHLHRAYPGIRVDLAYSSRRQLGEVEPLAAAVRASGGEALDLRVGNAPEPADFSAFIRLSAMIHRRRPQVIHAHSSKAGALVRLRGILPGCPPILYTPHAYYGLAHRGGAREVLFNAVEIALGRVGLTACCSPDERDFALTALRLPAEKLTVIINGIDLEKFRPAPPDEKRRLRAQLGVPADGRLLVTVGRDGPQKNYAALYAALDRVFAAHPTLRFAHAGEGSPARVARLRPAAQARCHAFEFLAAPQALLRAADGFILPSLYEGLSLSMLEAVSCGLAVILSDVSGLRCIRDLGFDAVRWLSDPRDRPNFESATVAAIADWLAADEGEPPGQRARAVEQFDHATQIGKIVALYHSLA